MSIRPIDFHATYSNTVNESKIKQNDLNRAKDTSTYAQYQQVAEVEKNKKRIVDTEKTLKKRVRPEDKKQPTDWEKGKGKEEDKDRKKEKGEPLSSKGKTKGLKIDIMI